MSVTWVAPTLFCNLGTSPSFSGKACRSNRSMSQPIHSSAGSAETGADSAPSLEAADPPLAPFQRSWALPRPHHRCHFHPRTPCGSRRSCRPRSLGGRPIAWGRNRPRDHAGRAPIALLRAGEGVRRTTTATVVTALIQYVRQLPAALRRSLTWDRGLEMAEHKSFTMATDVQVYFCDPQSPWQRGSNENTNGLLRQYLPKKADLSRFSQSELDEIALRLNTRPRQTLGFRTPADKLQASVASTP